MGQNVTIGKEGRHETGRKNVTEWCFVTIQAKKGECFVTATLRHPWGWVDVKSLDVLSGDEVS
jgi:hypothetical protein